MTDNVGIIPANIPWDMSGNTISPVWYIFLQQLWTRSGGSSAQTNNELAAGQLDDAGIEEIKAELYAMRSEFSNAIVRIEQIVDELNKFPAVQAGYDYNPALVQIAGGSIDNVTIGATTPSTGKFTDVTNGNIAALIKTSVTMNNGAGASAGTLTNAPTAGNPTKWVPFNDNGTVRYFPSWQ